MKIFKTISIGIVLLFTVFSTYSQVEFSTSAINAGGTDFRNNEFYLTSSIGEMAAVHTVFVPNLILSNGVLQPPLRRAIAGMPTALRFLYLYPTVLRDNYVYLDAAVIGKATASITTYNVSGQVLSRSSVIVDPSIYRSPVVLNIATVGDYFVEVRISGEQFSHPYKRTFKIQRF